MAYNNNELLENIVNEQEKLKLRLSNLEKLHSIVSSAIVKHKSALPNNNEALLKKISDGNKKVICTCSEKETVRSKNVLVF